MNLYLSLVEIRSVTSEVKCRKKERREKIQKIKMAMITLLRVLVNRNDNKHSSLTLTLTNHSDMHPFSPVRCSHQANASDESNYHVCWHRLPTQHTHHVADTGQLWSSLLWQCISSKKHTETRRHSGGQAEAGWLGVYLYTLSWLKTA